MEMSCKIFEYIQNVKVKRSGPTIVGWDAFTNKFLILVYIQDGIQERVLSDIENVNFKKSGPTIVGPDAFTNHFLILVYILDGIQERVL